MGLSKKPYKGTRDFLPKEKRVQDYLFKKMHQSAQAFGFEHYDGPMIEEVELYKAKSGEELINDQIYSFEDRGKRFVAIRPEMTPTLARMVAKVHREIPKPIRWYSIPNLLRYERPQRGRLREHWQYNCDIFGAPGRKGEIEIIQLLIEFLSNFGATEKHFEVLINDRTIVDSIFNKVTENQEVVYKLYKLVDKSKKIPKEAFDKELNELGVAEEGKVIFNDYLKLDTFEALFQFLDKLNLKEASENFRLFFNDIKGLNVDEFLKYDPCIVRGLDYYTGVVFEVFDKHPDNRRAICGGGAYANLLQIFGEPSLPGVGFGLGDVTLTDFLDSHDLLPDFSTPVNDVFVSYQIEAGFQDLSPIVRHLRSQDLKVVNGLEPLKFKKAFSSAEKLGARFVILYGEQEKENGIFILKDNTTKEQKEIKLTDFDALTQAIK